MEFYENEQALLNIAYAKTDYYCYHRTKVVFRKATTDWYEPTSIPHSNYICMINH